MGDMEKQPKDIAYLGTRSRSWTTWPLAYSILIAIAVCLDRETVLNKRMNVGLVIALWKVMGYPGCLLGQ